MKSERILISILVLALLLALAAGLSQAQGPEPPQADVSTEGELGATAMVSGKIPIQGRLTDASGNPLNGAYSVRFRLYDAATGGTLLCDDTHTVNVSNGLFSTEMDGCTPSDINGRQVYLGIQVGADPEMTPRQPIYPVPYAFSLVAGADLRGSLSGQPMLTVENQSSEWSTGMSGIASATSGENYGVHGKSASASGYGGYFENSTSTGAALKAGGSGIIKSSARSYVWISGNNLRKKYSADSTELEMDTYGGVKVTRGAGSGTTRDLMLPVTLPGQLYGQNVTLTRIDVYFASQSDFDGIGGTFVRRQSQAGSGNTIISDGTDRSCAVGTACDYHLDLTQNNVLSDAQGVVYIGFQLFFAGADTYVQIGGVRLTLEHD